MAGQKRRQIRGMPIDRPKSLAVIVADRLRAAICRAEIGLGEVLSEETIASAMNVSRTPVREAFTLLQAQGLINIYPQRGTVVFRPDAEDIRALVQYRLMIETQAAKITMAHDPVHAQAKLSKAVAMMTKARESEDALLYAVADDLFHRAFIEHCGNHYVREGYETCASRIAALRAHLSSPLEMYRNQTFNEHVEMLEAFIAADEETLVAILREHISNMEGNYIRALEII
ncbi:MAG: GntR family transcriptional regulator [Hoeflea sp.]|uniref:GntR family transcriptional regulator n=1 Tax=Hoeflea sp. TaxID=1940281 RepID=UPI00329721D3